MAFAFRSPRKDPDTPALKRIGDSVRARLAADPQVFQLPVEGLELFGISQFFSETECQRLIAIVDAVARPSPTYHGNGDMGRTSFTGDVNPDDPFVRMLQRRIDDLLGIDPAFGETIQGQRYAVGQEFRNHFDHFLPNQDFWEDEQRRGGQRSWTAMAYLNAVEEGGETVFPRAGTSVPPQPGALLVWNNMGLDGRPNTNAVHAGSPVRRGIKYVLTKWYRSRPWS